MGVPTLKELRALKNKLEESKHYKGARLTPEGGKDFSRTKTGEVKQVAREEGVAAAPKEGQVEHGKSGAPEGTTVKQNTAKEGVAAAVKEFKAEPKLQGDTKQVAREEGVAAAPKEWIKVSEYRNNLRSKLGLPLTDKLNKGNDGLNKSAAKPSVDGNKAGTPV